MEKEILEQHPIIYKKIEEEKLSIRNIENIQGDEADIVIASVIYDHTTNISSTYVARDGGKNALNVAISRTRDKMIVIKSITSKTIKNAKSSDFVTFKNWFEFLDMSEAEQKAFSKQGENKLEEIYGESDSKFERDVIEFLKANLLTVNKVKNN
ncbi:AAA domain-containing protein [Spiroplasma endosymbiont of Labia minor]|uniref:AAA domain-containing protein n=1 Tax=Spiroplasma endosymbiont of Labia minor TaxID=3066305 RepID=UPI0030D47986